MRRLVPTIVLLLVLPLTAKITDPHPKWVRHHLYGAGSLAVLGRTVLVGTERELQGFEASTGEPLWRKPSLGARERMVLCGEGVLSQSDEDSLSLLAADGKTLWTVPAAKPDWAVCHRGGVILAWRGGSVRAVDARKGTLRWKEELGAMAAGPVALGEQVYFFASGSLLARRILTGQETAKASIPAPLHLAGGTQPPMLLLAYRKGIVALDPAALKQRWSVPIVGGKLQAAPKSSEGLVLVPTQDGIEALDPLDGKLRWRYFLGVAVPYPVEAGEGAAYLAAANDFLYAVDLNGRELWRHQCGPVVAAPVLRAGVLYALNAQGTLFAFREHTGTADLERAITDTFVGRPSAMLSQVQDIPKQARVTHFLVEREIERLVEELAGADSGGAKGKPVVAVFALEGSGAPQGSPAPVFTDMIIEQFMNSPKYAVVERPRLDRVLQELRLSQTPYVDPKTALKVGRLVAANRVVTGSVSRVGDFYEVNARLVETETGVLLRAYSVQVRRRLVEP